MESIYRECNWGHLQEKKENGKASTYIFQNDDGRIEYPFIKRKAGIIDNVLYYDLVTARGECGPKLEIFNEKNKANLIKRYDEEFQEYCNENNIIAEYIKFEPWINYSDYFKEIYNINFHGNLYEIYLEEDFLNTEFSSSKRRDVKREIRDDKIKIEFDFEGKTIKNFIKLYNFTQNKYQLSDYYILNEEFIEKYFCELKDKVFIANAYYDKNLISSVIILLGKDIAHYHFSANNPAYGKLCANSYILYRCMEYSKKIGKKIFDLGGATPESSLERFKMSLINRREDSIYPYNVGTKIRNRKIYDDLVKQAGGPRKGYFPEYRK